MTRDSAFRPELRLLFLCARARMDAEQQRRAEALLRESFDWEYLFLMAMRHGLMPLVHKHLSEHFTEGVPPEQLNKFREHYRHNAARNLFLTGELCRLLRLFEQQGIMAVPYKGPALAVSAYGDASLRQFIDLDVLVRPRDVRRASALLTEQGYEPHFKLDAAQESAFLRLSYVQSFTQDEKRRTVELHWALAPRFFSFPLTAELIFERLETVRLGPCEAPAPAVEDTILMLSAHGAKDMWERLEWVCGLAELASRPEVDWPRLFARAEKLGGRRMLLLALSLARNLLETPLPEEVMHRLRGETKVEALAREVVRRMFDERGTAQSLKRMAVFHLRTKERVRDRVRYCALLAATTTPVDWALAPLPPALSFVYYFLRPFRLAKKYVWSASKRVL